MNATKLPRDANGTYTAYAWPGGYPVGYVTADCDVICAACMNGENGAEFVERPDGETGLIDEDLQWYVDGYFIHYEGAPETCCHCNAEIPSAYGEQDDDADDIGALDED